MAGIFDEVMDGINAKEKKDGTTPAAQPAAAPVQPPAQTPAPAEGNEKPLHAYSNEFNEAYGERKPA